MTARQALAFVRKHGIVLEAASGPVPSLAGAVTGEPIRGSWWAHPRGREIFQLTRAVRDSKDVLVCRLVAGRITYVHRRLWAPLVRAAKQFPRKHLAQIHETHTASGRHLTREAPFPEWVPGEVSTHAARLSEEEALARLNATTLRRRDVLKVLLLALLPPLSSACGLRTEGPRLSHGPLLGGVTESTAAVWLRTDRPADIEVSLVASGDGSEVARKRTHTSAESDLTFTARFDGLKPDAEYRYRIRLEGRPQLEAAFRTPGPGARDRPLRIVYGSCYSPRYNVKWGRSIFSQMAQLGPDIALFLGDFPYTKQGRLEELREMHKKIRSDAGFLHLTSSTPTFAIWDDHDFGPDDADGTHPYAAEALGGFKEWWPNPSYGLPGTDGIFTSVRWGDAEIFLLDDRFHQRQPPSAPALLGEQQLRWLLEGLASSTARYKVIVSGTQFGRTKRDAWAAPHHVKEREALLGLLARPQTTGVVFLSGDSHRVEIYRFPIRPGLYLYDLTSSPLGKRMKPPDDTDTRVGEKLYSHREQEPLLRAGAAPCRGQRDRAGAPGLLRSRQSDSQAHTLPCRSGAVTCRRCT